MRSIFLTLVVVNVVVAALMFFRPPAGEVVVAASEDTPRGRQLVLLGERDEQVESPVRDRVPFPQSGDAGAESEGFVANARGEESFTGNTGSLCTFVGPFKAMLPAEYFSEHLSALEVSSQVLRMEVAGEPSYWVYQAPESSRKAALRKLHELQSKGIDSYVIPKGELEDGISFGLYSTPEGAQERLAEVQARGYEVKIKRNDRTFEEVWVSLKSEDAQKVGQDLWFELMNREDGLEKRQNFCPAVASE